MRKLPGVTLPAILGLLYLVETHLGANMWRLTDDYTLALRLFQLSAFINVAILCFIVLIAVPREDILGRILWAVAFVLETYTIAEYTACKILGGKYDDGVLQGVWGTEVAKGSCARVVGPIGDWIEIILAAAILSWVAVRYGETVWRYMKAMKG